MAGALLLMLAACSSEQVELERAISPDHQVVATLRAEVVGGAVGDTSYSLHLQSLDSQEKSGSIQMIASGCGALTLAWGDKSTLNVKYESGCHIKEFESIWFDPADVRAGRSPARKVEIVLSRNETHSSWAR
jgi:hypothetical protein